ncbi:hypothetical protein chiPu_0027398 [Chiloscyllium punctatum]|uniref:Uncharacterized protein n=1 Tax=Chiloscyllium punctatum TaxID=137246 RepID=A0A401TL64_CHIPU|nr:hypothetical protein [Chiloscyllium punctatum]
MSLRYRFKQLQHLLRLILISSFLIYFQESDIIKIQAFIRANKARDDYKTLINAEQPPMAVVRKFVHLLDQSDQDFQEELEMMRLREEVVTRIRSNQQLENDLNTMDIKIGLLVKNKITLQVMGIKTSEQRE